MENTDNHLSKPSIFIFVLILSLSPFGYMYINKFFQQFESSYLLEIKTYDVMMFIIAFFLLSYKKLFEIMNWDILYSKKPVSLSVLLVTMYSIISFSVGIVIVKEEVVYLTNYFPYLESFKFVSTINYFDFYDKLLWENVSYVNNLTVLSSFLKVWIIGFLLIFNPFTMKENFLNIKINERNMSILFLIVLSVSLYDSLNVDSVNLMKANYYFFKQALIFLIIFLVLCNINKFQNDKEFEKTFFNSEVMLVYVMLISLQTLFYHYVYNVYFLEVVLIILAVASRDKFNLKTNKYFFAMLIILFLYEVIFLIINSNMIEKSLLEKIIAMSISVCLYFYKDVFLNYYRSKFSKYKNEDEETFKLEFLKKSFNTKFGKIFDVSQVKTIIYDGFLYKINDEIVFEIQYPYNIKNPYFFNFRIVYNEDKKYIDWFLDELRDNFILGLNTKIYFKGKLVKTSGTRLYTFGFKNAEYITVLYSYNQRYYDDLNSNKAIE